MRAPDFRADRLLASMLSRRSEIRRRLDLKDSTRPYNHNQGFVYLIRGAERVQLEQELAQIGGWIALLKHEANSEQQEL